MVALVYFLVFTGLFICYGVPCLYRVLRQPVLRLWREFAYWTFGGDTEPEEATHED
jgi:hypothetical protein